jgi:hypothetical protein
VGSAWPTAASTWQELSDLLNRDLYVEGDPEHNIRVDQHSVRAKTDNDEVDLAYFFVDDALLRSRPDCGAYWSGRTGGCHRPAAAITVGSGCRSPSKS